MILPWKDSTSVKMRTPLKQAFHGIIIDPFVEESKMFFPVTGFGSSGPSGRQVFHHWPFRRDSSPAFTLPAGISLGRNWFSPMISNIFEEFLFPEGCIFSEIDPSNWRSKEPLMHSYNGTTKSHPPLRVSKIDPNLCC